MPSAVSDAIEFIGDIEFSFEGLGAFVVRWADRVLGTIIGLNKAIVAAFQNITDPIILTFQSAFNALVPIINNFINNVVIDPINKVREFFKLGLIDPVTIDELTTKAEGSFRDAGTAIKDAFLEGFNANVIADTVETVMVRAKQIAEDRIASEAVPDPVPDPGLPDAKPTTTGTGTEPSSIKLTEDEIAVLEEKRAAVTDLIGAIDLVAGATNTLSNAQDVLKFAVQDGTISAQEQTDLLARLERELVGVGNATADFEDKVELLQSALNRGVISSKEMRDSVRDLKIELLDESTELGDGFTRFFLKAQRDAEDAAQLMEDALTDAFDVAGDALSDFVKTGKFQLSDLAGDLSEILIKFGLQTLTGAITGGFGGGGISPVSTEAALSDTGRFLDFAHGGQFNVDGSTGIPSTSPGEDRFVGLNLRKGERVTVDPVGGSQSGGSVSVTQVFPGISDVNALGRNRGQINQRAFRTGQIVAGRNRA
jgi:predicted Zn-dependent protease with MMP-like domain